MKLVIVGTGCTPIPPKGWGAVESLIWDYYTYIKKYHTDIDVSIVNVPKHQMIQEINAINPDIVHIQYDDHADITPYLTCKLVLFTTHYAYLTQKNTTRSNDGYFRYNYPKILQNPRGKLFALSRDIADLYIADGFPSENVYVHHNGANEDLFRYTDVPAYPDRSIYLAKVETRKGQYKYQSIPCIYFAGGCQDSNFNISSPQYLGEWTKEVLYHNLTDFANLILLSEGEAHPLVICEALVCGLGVVISECSAANLDRSLPFIDVIPNEKLNDIPYVESIIRVNQQKSVAMRTQIREYGIKTFGWKNVVEKYVARLKELYANAA